MRILEISKLIEVIFEAKFMIMLILKVVNLTEYKQQLINHINTTYTRSEYKGRGKGEERYPFKSPKKK